MNKISKQETVRMLCDNVTVFAYYPKALRNGEYEHKQPFSLDELMCMFNEGSIRDMSLQCHRDAQRKSYGVVFSGGSELRLLTDKGRHECFTFSLFGRECVYVDCDYCAMFYFID